MLVLDRDRNGTVSNAGELSIVDDVAGARSGLARLGALDSNRDGLLSAADDSFSRFYLWADADRDGAVDIGEFRSLADQGVGSLALNGTAVSQTWAAGANTVVDTEPPAASTRIRSRSPTWPCCLSDSARKTAC